MPAAPASGDSLLDGAPAAPVAPVGPGGPTAEQIVKQIAKNPKAYRHLMKKGPKVHHVGAQRREIEPKLANEPRDDS